LGFSATAANANVIAAFFVPVLKVVDNGAWAGGAASPLMAGARQLL
jgi:hypothetical protein